MQYLEGEVVLVQCPVYGRNPVKQADWVNSGQCPDTCQRVRMEWAEVDEGFYGIERSASLIKLDRQGESLGCFSGSGHGGGRRQIVQGAGVR